METKNRDDELTESQQLELQYNKKNLEHLNSMKKNKEVVKDVCDKLKNLIALEGGLREASEYRSSLQDNYTKLSGYLKNMEDIVDTYSRGFAAGQKFDKSVVKNNVNNFEKYAKKAKEIGINLNNIEKDIKQLLEIQSTRDEVEKLRTANANLQRQLEDNNKQPEKSEDLPSGATENIKSQGQKTSDKKAEYKKPKPKKPEYEKSEPKKTEYEKSDKKDSETNENNEEQISIYPLKKKYEELSYDVKRLNLEISIYNSIGKGHKPSLIKRIENLNQDIQSFKEKVDDMSEENRRDLAHEIGTYTRDLMRFIDSKLTIEDIK